MCEFIKGSHVALGWGCCRCRVYNGIQREKCKSCGEPYHDPLDITGDCKTGFYSEDGGLTEVEVLSVNPSEEHSGSRGVGIRLKAIRTEQSSRLLKDIPVGEVFDVWQAHDAGAYGGMWRLE